MDNTQAITLSDIADTQEFLENPLDVYESYTYNIEWFVVDRDSDQRFQEFGETLDAITIVNDGWPTPQDTKITIAKTGVTTEFNLTDLSIQSVGAGIAETSKIAGTAITLDFTVTQVGETSLVDNLQNAIALTGWRTIDSTHFYIKINFVGVDKNGKKVKIPQTKIFTFTLQSVTQLSTETDTRGTSTVLQGTILPDTVISNKRQISSTENGFTFEVAETLHDTLGVTEDDTETPPKEGSFIDELNKSIKISHPTLTENLQNTYKITMSDQFKEWTKDSSMKGITSNSIKNMKPPDARYIGQVTPLMSIFKIIDDICINTKTIKESAIRDTPGNSKIHKITPWLVPKGNGYNPVTGTMTYNVEFFLDYEKKYITQNMLDQANKVKNIQKTVQELFEEQHVNKIYHYLFTGKNDQILDFNITLDNELAKIYSAPTDWYAYENILKAGTPEGDEILKGLKEIVDASEEDGKILIEREMQSIELLKDIKKGLNNFEDSLMADIRKAILAKMQIGMDLSGNLREQEVNKFIGNKSSDQLIAELSASDEYEGMTPLFAQALKTRNDWKEKVAFAEDEWINDKRHLDASEKNKDKLYGDFVASAASVSNELNWKNGVKQNAQKLLSGVANKNPKNMILLEELDNDIISKMSNEDFENILKAQANNPIVYKRLISILSKNPSTVTIKPTDPEGVELARAKYYESKSNNVSMIHAQMGIKGDPHWLDGYMSPSLAKKEFGNAGAVTDKGYNAQTVVNGANGLILKSGIADGTDLHSNVLKRNLITSLFIVKAVTSSFSGGLFTQNLSMTKLAEAEAMSTVKSKVGPIREVGDKNSPGHPSNQNYNYYTPKEDNIVPIDLGSASPVDIHGDEITKHIDDYTEKEIVKKVESITTIDEEEFRKNWAEIQRINKMEDAMSSYGQRTGIGQEPITTAPKWLNKNTEKIVNAQDTTTNHTITAQSGMVGHFNPTGDAIVRNVLANQTLDSLPKLHRACLSQQKGLVLPFTACDSIKETNKEMLESFGLTADDQGKASTVTAMNNQINSWIANDGITFSDEEIAVYQIAAGGELNITGHDPDDVQKLVKRATFERTPQIILDEQANGITTENYYTESGVADNRILDGSAPLNVEVVEATEINTTIIQPYQKADGTIKTDEDFEAEYEALYADTTCVGACRITKVLKLTNVQNDAWIAQAKLDKIKDIKVNKIVKESCPAGTENKINIKNRRLECVPILPETLTDSEMDDVDILKEEINKTLKENYYTESGIAEEMAWKANAVELIETELNDNDLVITDKDKTALKFAAAAQINNTIALNELSDNDYRKIQGYETGIKTVIATAQDGHRGDLTNAVNVGITEDALADLSASKANTTTKLNQYWWDTNDKRVWVDQLEDTEVEIAEKMLYLPDENMTAVATIINGTDKTFVPIYNPTNQVVVSDQPLIIKNADEQFDVVLSGGDSTYAGVTSQDNIDQITQARNVYYALTSTGAGDMTTVEDDWGVDISVKDFSNISPITYVDANGVSQTISNPSTFFDIHTTSKSDMYPAYKKDYTVLRNKVADLFPNIEVISGETTAAYLSTNKNGKGMVILNGTAFYINP